jgi:hypothetical protein
MLETVEEEVECEVELELVIAPAERGVRVVTDALEQRGDVRVLAGHLPGDEQRDRKRLRVVPRLSRIPEGSGPERVQHVMGHVFIVSRTREA